MAEEVFTAVPEVESLSAQLGSQAEENPSDLAGGMSVSGTNEAIIWAGLIEQSQRKKSDKEILEEIGLDGDRLDMFFMSGSQGQSFAIAAHTMTERIRKLGPNPLKPMKIPNVLESAEISQAPETYMEDENGFP